MTASQDEVENAALDLAVLPHALCVSNDERKASSGNEYKAVCTPI